MEHLLLLYPIHELHTKNKVRIKDMSMYESNTMTEKEGRKEGLGLGLVRRSIDITR